MTMWQLRVCLEGHNEIKASEYEQMIAMQWHGASFQRAQKLPRLSEILARLKQPMEKPHNGDIISIMKTQLARRGR